MYNVSLVPATSIFGQLNLLDQVKPSVAGTPDASNIDQLSQRVARFNRMCTITKWGATGLKFGIKFLASDKGAVVGGAVAGPAGAVAGAGLGHIAGTLLSSVIDTAKSTIIDYLSSNISNHCLEQIKTHSDSFSITQGGDHAALHQRASQFFDEAFTRLTANGAPHEVAQYIILRAVNQTGRCLVQQANEIKWDLAQIATNVATNLAATQVFIASNYQLATDTQNKLQQLNQNVNDLATVVCHQIFGGTPPSAAQQTSAAGNVPFTQMQSDLNQYLTNAANLKTTLQDLQQWEHVFDSLSDLGVLSGSSSLVKFAAVGKTVAQASQHFTTLKSLLSSGATITSVASLVAPTLGVVVAGFSLYKLFFGSDSNPIEQQTLEQLKLMQNMVTHMHKEMIRGFHHVDKSIQHSTRVILLGLCEGFMQLSEQMENHHRVLHSYLDCQFDKIQDTLGYLDASIRDLAQESAIQQFNQTVRPFLVNGEDTDHFTTLSLPTLTTNCASIETWASQNSKGRYLAGSNPAVSTKLEDPIIINSILRGHPLNRFGFLAMYCNSKMSDSSLKKLFLDDNVPNPIIWLNSVEAYIKLRRACFHLHMASSASTIQSETQRMVETGEKISQFVLHLRHPEVIKWVFQQYAAYLEQFSKEIHQKLQDTSLQTKIPGVDLTKDEGLNFQQDVVNGHTIALSAAPMGLDKNVIFSHFNRRVSKNPKAPASDLSLKFDLYTRSFPLIGATFSDVTQKNIVCRVLGIAEQMGLGKVQFQTPEMIKKHPQWHVSQEIHFVTNAGAHLAIARRTLKSSATRSTKCRCKCKCHTPHNKADTFSVSEEYESSSNLNKVVELCRLEYEQLRRKKVADITAQLNQTTPLQILNMKTSLFKLFLSAMGHPSDSTLFKGMMILPTADQLQKQLPQTGTKVLPKTVPLQAQLHWTDLNSKSISQTIHQTNPVAASLSERVSFLRPGLSRLAADVPPIQRPPIQVDTNLEFDDQLLWQIEGALLALRGLPEFVRTSSG